MNMSKDLSVAAERVSENAHQIWSKRMMEELSEKGAGMFMAMVPWDLLTDFERRKYRFRAQEILKFLQYHGYRVYK